MPQARLKLLGKKFGRLRVLKFARVVKNCSRWWCFCSCGNKKEVYGTHLTQGKTKSCGCLRVESVRALHKDLSGKRFGKILVIKRAPNSKVGHVHYHVLCDCGTKKVVAAGSLRFGHTKSCGCNANVKHGQCKNGRWTPTYALWMHAKDRAKILGLPFNLTVRDIVIPKKCPVLGILLKPSKGKNTGPIDSSPTIDRIIPEQGYVKSNIWVISGRANRAKSNLSLKELKKLVRALDKKLRSLK
jgi:hypothetical protein